MIQKISSKLKDLTDSTVGMSEPSEDNTSFAPEVSFKESILTYYRQISPRWIIDSLIICH